MALDNLRPRPCVRRRMNLYYLIDCSGSMNYNGCIESVNGTMPEIVEILRDVSLANNDHGDIYMSCITFSDSAQVCTPQPVSALSYSWTPVKAHGLTNMADALDKLDAQLTADLAAAGNRRFLRPAVIILSDGDPDPGWEEALERLEQNPMFRSAYKIAIAIGASPANVAMKRALTRFASDGTPGSVPNIISVTDLTRLTDVIRMVSGTVSRIGSRTTGAGGTPEGPDPVAAAVHAALQGGVEPMDGVKIPSIGPDSDFWD